MAHATRAVLLAHLLKSGATDRAARLYDRLSGPAIAGFVEQLDAADRRRVAALAFQPGQLHKCPELPFAALLALVRAAHDDDAQRALDALPRARASRVLMGLEKRRRERLSAARADDEPGPRREVLAAFRLRRIFA